MERFFETHVAAGYVIPFLLCPLNPRFPSAFVPVGMVSSDLTYTTGDVDSLLGQIQKGLCVAGFGHVVPTIAFDNPSVHRKFALLSGNPRGFPRDREPGGSLGAELLEGADAILTLGAYRRKGTTIETIVTIDTPHTVKNSSLQPLHLARLLTLGYYVMLTMMLVDVRVPAGLHASDVNGSDPMDVSAAERRLNVRTRRELAKHPESFGLLVYLWAMACGRAAWLDRDPHTTPRMRVRWAFNNLIFLRWWLDWIEVSGKPSGVHFISMETHAANVISAQMMVMLVLLWGRSFPDRPFAPWLVGSDQNEHFNSELRSFRINQPDWTFADVLRLAARFVHMLVLLTRPDVCLPKVFSKKGFNRSAYTPSADGEHVHPFPALAEIREEYWAAVAFIGQLFVALGAAQELCEAGRWHAPSLEEWVSIEKACDSQEKILKDKLVPGKRAESREYLVKWRGWSDAEEDLTWEAHIELAVSNPQLVWKYVQGVRLTGKSLKIDKPNDAQLEAAALADAGEEAEPAGGEPADAPARASPSQPEIEAVDRAALIETLTACIGAEQPNGKHSKALKHDATGAQRAAYDVSHVENEETGQFVHKRAALAFYQKQAKDAKPGAGHQQRYVTGERQPIIAEDKDGTGFACAQYYEVHVGQRGTPLNSEAELMLEGVLLVGYACVLELRKLNGKRRVPRLSVRAKDASRCSAVILPLVRRSSGQWVADRSVARPVLVPLLSLGRCVVASEGSGNRAGSFTIAAADQAAGGPTLRTMSLSEDLFAAAAMKAVEKDLMDMKVTELKEELASRDEPVSGNKAWLRRRLHAAIVREHLEAASEE
ncbi:hypothetical protein Ctob_013295 [Chrysochromulina tobinii]|uniref:Chromo domain-containing protein n=1 Tax=Chrysochromulina tobinii TaxID=1460289 RepID=A0A0M0JWX9_9EUKA|nr:hypothetical protein Ctob_013295 [Chrysochromulina tobinii]|eukprot:KOO30832.1 hypothetical protein Ctob_013295 [Chrysochromulina sp. CCMP291]